MIDNIMHSLPIIRVLLIANILLLIYHIINQYSITNYEITSNDECPQMNKIFSLAFARIHMMITIIYMYDRKIAAWASGGFIFMEYFFLLMLMPHYGPCFIVQSIFSLPIYLGVAGYVCYHCHKIKSMHPVQVRTATWCGHI
jgi:hypothetical protein